MVWDALRNRCDVCRGLLLTALLGLSAVTVAAQTAERRDPDDGRRGGGRHQHNERGRGRHGPALGRLFGMGPGPALFELHVSDRSPLREGEAEELMEFAREHIPRAYYLLNALREESPERFRQRLTEHAPRLRQMRRVYEYSPEIGELVRQHAETRLMMRKRAMRIARVRAPSLQERAWERLRGTVARSVELEIDILEARAEMLVAQRTALIEEASDHLLSSDAIPAGAPPRLRELLAAYHAAETEPARNAARSRLMEGIERRIDKEVQVLQTRADDLRADAPAEVDLRMERLRTEAEERGRRGGPPDDRPRRGRMERR